MYLYLHLYLSQHLYNYKYTTAVAMAVACTADMTADRDPRVHTSGTLYRGTQLSAVQYTARLLMCCTHSERDGNYHAPTTHALHTHIASTVAHPICATVYLTFGCSFARASSVCTEFTPFSVSTLQPSP